MQVHATIDTSQVTRQIAEILRFAEEESIPTVATTYKRLLTGHMIEGEDAFGRTFHEYSPQYAEYGRLRQGFTTSPKDLQKFQGRLYEMELVDDTLTYTDEETKNIASGQMYHPKWSYHHDFMNVSDESDRIAGHELEDLLRGRLG
jgi:hypothetical protein